MNEIVMYECTINNTIYSLTPETVLHDKEINLRYLDGAYCFGISKYVPGDKIARELKAIYDAKTSIIERRGAVGIITNESEVPDKEQTEAVQKKLAEEYGLRGDQNKFVVTTEKLKFQAMGLGIAELQLIENAKWNMAKVCQLNGIDPVVFSTEGSTFANKETAVKDMMNKVVKPRVDAYYENINFLLSGGYSGDKIVPDWSQVEELQADRKVLTDMLAIQEEHGVITPLKFYETIYGDYEGDEEAKPSNECYMKSGINKVNEPEPITPDPLTPDPELLGQLAETANSNGNGKH
jgi:hypothetical protein